MKWLDRANNKRHHQLVMGTENDKMLLRDAHVVHIRSVECAILI